MSDDMPVMNKTAAGIDVGAAENWVWVATSYLWSFGRMKESTTMLFHR